MKIAIFAAGTGGHIFPALSIAEEFKKDDVIFFASNRELEKQIYQKIKMNTQTNKHIPVMINQAVNFLPQKENLNIIVGGRYDNHNNIGSFFTPRLHFRYLLNDNFSIKGSIGTGRKIANVFAENQVIFLSNRINLNKTFKGIAASSGNSFVHETESQVILNGSYNINFTMDLVQKDLALFNQLSKKLNTPCLLNTSPSPRDS